MFFLLYHFSSLLSSVLELYSYTEEPEFSLNRDCFEEDFRSHGIVTTIMFNPVTVWCKRYAALLFASAVVTYFCFVPIISKSYSEFFMFVVDFVHVPLLWLVSVMEL